MSHGFLAPVLNRDREQAEDRRMAFLSCFAPRSFGRPRTMLRVLCPLLDPGSLRLPRRVSKKGLHGGSPRWSCVLPKGQINVNVNSAPSGLVGVGVDEGGAFAICFSPRVLRRFASDTPGRERS